MSCSGRNRTEDLMIRISQLKLPVDHTEEALAAEIPHAIERYREQTLPAVIQIPGVAGNTGAGVAGVKKSVEQAVGSDILFGEQ